MLSHCKRFRDASVVSYQQDTPIEATQETILGLVTSEKSEQTIPLLVVRLTYHDGVIDQVFDYLEQMPLERVEEMEDDIETLQARLASVEQEIMTLYARVGTLEQHDEDAYVTNKLEITELRSRVEDAETRLE
ncbi:hypothetical protein Tco_0211564 [Tanacetum coccineum]